ncbi:MAG: TonB-dependent receptor plug domain-containing protein [Gammaproteobacteria bacterium]
MIKGRLRRALAIAYVLGWAAAPGCASAGEEDELALVYGDNSIVSIATGNRQSVRRAPAVASVITAQDIAAMGATDLDQVLETVAGIHVNRSPNQYSPLYTVRGIGTAYQPQVLVLQNGVPMTTLYQSNKGNVWGGYPVEHIARIEVIRGPGSALYGSDAFAGVINIITFSALDAPGTRVGVRAGSFASRDAWLRHGGTHAGVEVAAYLRAGRTDGFRSIIEADAQTRNDQLYGTTASLAPGPVNTGNRALDGHLDISHGAWRLRTGYKLRDDVGTGAGISAALDPVGRSRSARLTADLSWTASQLARDWQAGALLSFLRYTQSAPMDYQLFPPGLRFPTGPFPDGMTGGPDTWERQTRLSAYLGYSGFAGHQLRAGLGQDHLDLYRTFETRNFDYAPNGLPIPLPASYEASATHPFLFPTLRKLSYAYLQDEWNFAPDWTMTAGLRHDQYSDFGGTTNPRLALVWDASFDLTAKLMFGRAFRAPAFIEAYGVYNPVAQGNPRLRPETNGTLEAALAWQASPDARLNLTLFRYAMSNIIRTVPNPVAGTGATYHNTGDQVGRGLELEGVWDAGRRLRLSGNYSYQHATDKNGSSGSGAEAGGVPRHHLYARADWQPREHIQLGGQLNRVARRARAAGDARPPIADYTTLDLSLRANVVSGWEVLAAVRNLFNADVREPSPAPGLQLPHDLPMAPRGVSVQLSYQL